VFDSACGARFGHEAAFELRVARPAHDFDRHAAASSLVRNVEDRAHSACSELPDHAEFFRDHGARGDVLSVFHRGS